LILDFYRAASEVYFYSSELRARSASVQWEHQFSKNWKARAAYRVQSVTAKYFGQWDQVPYIAPQRIMLHVEYQFRQQWFANATWQHYAGMRVAGRPRRHPSRTKSRLCRDCTPTCAAKPAGEMPTLG